MTDPPNIYKITSKTYQSQLGEPKFIIIKRNDNNSFERTSPFIIKKSVDFACGGEVEGCKRTRDGNLLIKTKNELQARKLLKLTKIADVDVTASEHKTLNFSKGVIYCNDLRHIDEDTILQELKPQKVSEVKKIMKRQNPNSNSDTNNITLVETGLIIITFESHKLPEIVRIGYETVRVRDYIPLPLRCKKCLRFGHPTPICKSVETCINCSETKHTTDGEKCTNEKNCLNCRNNPELDHQHSPIDRKCPTFIKNQELTAIKTTQKVDHKTAQHIYFERHGFQTKNTYAKTLTNGTTQRTTNTPSPNIHTNTTQSQHQNPHHTPKSAAQNTSSKTPTTEPAKTTLLSNQPHQHHHHHSYDKLEDMDTDYTPTRKPSTAYSSQLTEDLKIKIFPKDKSNNLSINLKASKLKAKAHKNKHTNNSDSESI
ncbi:uncharacterized protein LOC123327423 [Drosophila simulans]|uniref:uncharacterized protein LOC123327423 n=1 Tax=Drosophila simulans TaxID=7240 RepID=UPI001D115375|nr:uncharacterized protein LOC123327423 [Drosophila simulans]